MRAETLLGMVVLIFHSSTGDRDGWISEFEASLVYIVSKNKKDEVVEGGRALREKVSGNKY